jgi:glycosyltransferase involved in cell wall biosynthesis
LKNKEEARIIGHKAQAYVKEHFSVEKMIRELEELYIGLAEGSGTRVHAGYIP